MRRDFFYNCSYIFSELIDQILMILNRNKFEHVTQTVYSLNGNYHKSDYY